MLFSLFRGLSGAAILVAASATEAVPVPTVKYRQNTDAMVNSVTFNSDGSSVAISSAQQLRFFTVDNDSVTKWSYFWVSQDPDSPIVGQVAFRPHSSLLAVGKGGGKADKDKLGFYDIANSTPKLLSSLEDTSEYATFSPDGYWLSTGHAVYGHASPESWIKNDMSSFCGSAFEGAHAFAPDSKMVAIGSEPLVFGSEVVTLLQLSRGSSPQPLQKLSGVTGGAQALAFSADGKWLVAGAHGRMIRSRLGGCQGLFPNWDNIVLFSLTGHEGPKEHQRLSVKPHTCFITSVAFSPDSKRIAAGTADGNVLLFGMTETGATLEHVIDNEGWVPSVSFNANSTLLATGGTYFSLYDLLGRSPPPPQLYRCEQNKCVRSTKGASLQSCQTVCGSNSSEFVV